MEMRRGVSFAARGNLAVTAGTIKSLNESERTVTLDTGKVCHCDHSIDLAGFRPGDKVDMTFVEASGKSTCCAMSRAA